LEKTLIKFFFPDKNPLKSEDREMYRLSAANKNLAKAKSGDDFQRLSLFEKERLKPNKGKSAISPVEAEKFFSKQANKSKIFSFGYPTKKSVSAPTLSRSDEEVSVEQDEHLLRVRSKTDPLKKEKKRRKSKVSREDLNQIREEDEDSEEPTGITLAEFLMSDRH